MKHTGSACSDGLKIVEVQMGEEIRVKDKRKWEKEVIGSGGLWRTRKHSGEVFLFIVRFGL